MTLPNARHIVAAGLALSLGACTELRTTADSLPETPLIAAFRTYCIATRTAPEAASALLSRDGAAPIPETADMSARFGVNEARGWSITYADHLLVVATGQILSKKNAGMTSSACSVLDMDDRRSSEGTIKRWIPSYKPGDLSSYSVGIRHGEIEPSPSGRIEADGTGPPVVGYKLSADIHESHTLLTLIRKTTRAPSATGRERP